MTIREKKMRELVIEEAKNLKKYATKKELNKLNFKKLNPDNTNYCVYGQMTGDCYSNRANDLILNCCERVYNVSNELGKSVSKGILNGKPKYIKNYLRKDYYHSPIETFIIQPKNMTNGNNEKLVKFLRGEIKTLNFK